MKKFLAVVAVVFSLGLAGGLTTAAQAGGGCAAFSCGSDKVASSCGGAAEQVAMVKGGAAATSDCAVACDDVMKAAKVAGCPAAAGCDVKAEQVAMVKGGAAATSDCAASCGADKVAKADCTDKCAEKCEKAEQVAMVKGGAAAASDCAASCGADKVAACAEKCGDKCEKAEQVAMAKGGAAEGNYGYTLGKKVPNFAYEDIHGKKHSLSDYNGKIVALIFWNHRCPWVIEMDDRLADFTKRYQEDVVVLTIDAGINNSVEDIKTYGQEFPFHLLINRDSDLARKFDAKFTPEVFLLDREGVIVYTGAFDNSRAGSAEGARRSYMEDAVKAILAGNPIDVVQTRAFGCTIKFAPKAEAASATTY